MDDAGNTPERVERIRQLNDQLRTKGLGGRVLITRGLAALGPERAAEALRAVAAFDGFDEGNDPWGEHDCASFTVSGERVIWKIDYYDKALTAGSPDPADPSVTGRVLTVMLSEEY